jgi:phosphatidylglycerophosphate synthase
MPVAFFASLSQIPLVAAWCAQLLIVRFSLTPYLQQWHTEHSKLTEIPISGFQEWLTLNAFTAADEVIVSLGYFELDSIVQISKTIVETKRQFNPNLELPGLLFTMSDLSVKTANSLTILRKMHGDHLLLTIIPRNTDLRDAHFSKKE